MENVFEEHKKKKLTIFEANLKQMLHNTRKPTQTYWMQQMYGRIFDNN